MALGTLASLALAACGGGDEQQHHGGTTSSTTTTTAAGGVAVAAAGTVSLSADPSGALAYQETSLTAKAGKDTIDFDNPSSTRPRRLRPGLRAARRSGAAT